MESIAGEITLYDLLAWEPRLRPIGDLAPATLLERAVDWVLTARPLAPMLPLLRGGELVILPQRVVRETGLPIDRLVAEITLQPIAGVVTDAPTGSTPRHLPLLSIDEITLDTENDLNRLIATQRRDILQRIADIDLTLSDALARRRRPGELLDVVGGALDCGIVLTARSGARVYATARQDIEPHADDHRWIRRELRNGQTLWAGPIAPTQRALIRAAMTHVQEALQRSLDLAATDAPRGNARTSALNALLQIDAANVPPDFTEQALAVGVPDGAPLAIALFSPNLTESSERSAIAWLGESREAGALDGYSARVVLVHASPRPPTASPAPGDLVLTSPVVSSLDELPEAIALARFAGMLVRAGLIAPAMIRLDDLRELGVYRLLYEPWRSRSLASFRDAHLASLLADDARGQLVDTLSAYLAHGGAQRPTADALGIHRNTLRYRLGHIRESLDANLDEPHARLTLHVALTAHRLLSLDD